MITSSKGGLYLHEGVQPNVLHILQHNRYDFFSPHNRWMGYKLEEDNSWPYYKQKYDEWGVAIPDAFL